MSIKSPWLNLNYLLFHNYSASNFGTSSYRVKIRLNDTFYISCTGILVFVQWCQSWRLMMFNLAILVFLYDNIVPLQYMTRTQDSHHYGYNIKTVTGWFPQQELVMMSCNVILAVASCWYNMLTRVFYDRLGKPHWESPILNIFWCHISAHECPLL